MFLTPHMGSATLETRISMGHRALDNLEAVLAGRPPIDPVRASPRARPSGPDQLPERLREAT